MQSHLSPGDVRNAASRTIAVIQLEKPAPPSGHKARGPARGLWGRWYFLCSTSSKGNKETSQWSIKGISNYREGTCCTQASLAWCGDLESICMAGAEPFDVRPTEREELLERGQSRTWRHWVNAELTVPALPRPLVMQDSPTREFSGKLIQINFSSGLVKPH